jgi:AcrR family transcriptional regulator
MSNNDRVRDRLLQETEQAILQQGFFGVSMRKVALNVGVHPGTVVSLFGNKRNLLRTVEARLQDRQARLPLPAPVVLLRED